VFYVAGAIAKALTNRLDWLNQFKQKAKLNLIVRSAPKW
jgi:hypothetical protein